MIRGELLDLLRFLLVDSGYFNVMKFCSEFYLVIRRKKMVPGGLMKAVARPGGGEATPAEGDQVASYLYLMHFLWA